MTPRLLVGTCLGLLSIEPEARIVLSAQPATLWKRLNRGSELHSFLPGWDESLSWPAVEVRS